MPTIGIFSSSYPLTAIAPRATEDAIAYLSSHGIKVRCGKLTGKRDFYRSGSIRERAEEFNALLADPEIECLMSSVGGFVTNAILPYIDYDLLRKRPKAIIGMSDVTALLLSIYQKTGIPTYYGPNLVTHFAQKDPFLQDTLDSMLDVVFNREPRPYVYQMPSSYSDELTNWNEPIAAKKPKPNRWLTVQGGCAAGRLIGGNLNTISAVMGSPYMPEIREGDILFLEDTEKWAAHSERYLGMLNICGVFERVGGIILGKHRQYDDQGTGRTQTDILLEILDGRKMPILADVDCSHTIPMLTLPIGGQVMLDADKREITLLQA